MKTGAVEFSRLLAGVREGSEQAAWDLLTEYGEFVFRVVRKRLPQDLRRAFDSHDFVQVVWASIFRHRSRLSRFETSGEFVAFLAAVAANKVCLEIRRRLRQQKHNMNRDRPFDSSANYCAAAEATPSQVAIARENWFRLLEGQPPHYQEIIRLRYLGHSFREIASRVGLDEGSVRRILRKMFRDLKG
ncbi:MAG: RNA polymerase sigma factor [Pirellulaceae bacterium]